MASDEYVSCGWACVDCLILLANGEDPVGTMSEEEISEWHADIDAVTAGLRVTLGLTREEHECATNFTVRAVGYKAPDNGPSWPPSPVRYVYEYRAASEQDARDLFYWDAENGAKIVRVTEHELRTAGDDGNECECERRTFSSLSCDHCDSRLAGERHAISFWKILP
jgi:hypothetical protein